MRRTGKSKHFAAEGCDVLLRDKTRPSRIPQLVPEIAERVAALTLAEPPGETTHWIADMMAKSCRNQRQRSQAHLEGPSGRPMVSPPSRASIRVSDDPKFIDKLRDVVGRSAGPRYRAVGR